MKRMVRVAIAGAALASVVLLAMRAMDETYGGDTKFYGPIRLKFPLSSDSIYEIVNRGTLEL